MRWEGRHEDSRPGTGPRIAEHQTLVAPMGAGALVSMGNLGPRGGQRLAHQPGGSTAST